MIIDYEALGAMTLRQFCSQYAVGRSRAYELLNAGSIQARKAGKSLLIDRASAERWFQSLPAYKPQSPRATAYKGAPAIRTAIPAPAEKVAKPAIGPGPWSTPESTPAAPSP